jgi:hypothetical protein
MFSISSGSLPSGLNLDAALGIISGTPSGSGGTATFTVQVTDSSSPVQIATANLSITVVTALAVTATALPGATEGTAYSAAVTASGGIPPYVFSISGGSLPSGLNLDAATGIISGTPSGTGGTATFTVQVTDSSSPVQIATANLSITVVTALPGAAEGAAHSTTVAVSGGKSPYAFFIISGSILN